jgi:hypothetical protein
LLALGGICFVTLMLHYFESARLFKDKSKISEPKIVNETTIDDVLILVFTGKRNFELFEFTKLFQIILFLL